LLYVCSEISKRIFVVAAVIYLLIDYRRHQFRPRTGGPKVTTFRPTKQEGAVNKPII